MMNNTLRETCIHQCHEIHRFNQRLISTSSLKRTQCIDWWWLRRANSPFSYSKRFSKWIYLCWLSSFFNKIFKFLSFSYLLNSWQTWLVILLIYNIKFSLYRVRVNLQFTKISQTGRSCTRIDCSPLHLKNFISQQIDFFEQWILNTVKCTENMIFVRYFAFSLSKIYLILFVDQLSLI
jgi:hypothetical protein